MRECYIPTIRSINLIIKDILVWVIPKNIEDVEKWAQKKEGPVREINENRSFKWKK
tara:strand:- start:75 stop:242 length:168 start_codon:yes stop_codon:yes gene_type:complete